ncbi:MAG: PAS domain S-box protein [Halothece sp.]
MNQVQISQPQQSPEQVTALEQQNQQLTEQVQQLRTELDQVKQQLEHETQQRELKKAIYQTSEQRWQKIFEYSNDAILVLDPQQDCILEANPKATQMLGYSRKELLNSIDISNIHPDEMPQLSAFSQAVVSQGYGWTNELTCLTKSGRAGLLTNGFLI